jgi:hypothetical protein
MRRLRRFSLLSLALLLFTGVGCTSTDTLTEAPSTSSPDQPSPQFGLIGDLTGGLTNTVGDLTGGLTNTVDDLTGGLSNTVGDLTSTVVGTLGSVTNLLLCSPQPYAFKTEVIGPQGGTLAVGPHRLIIPRGALSQSVRITAEQVRGSTNSVRFSPEGLRFDRPAALIMSYENCALVLLQKKIVYTNEKLKILEVLSSVDLFKRKTVRAPIDHFSRYAVAY